MFPSFLKVGEAPTAVTGEPQCAPPSVLEADPELVADPVADIGRVDQPGDAAVPDEHVLDHRVAVGRRGRRRDDGRPGVARGRGPEDRRAAVTALVSQQHRRREHADGGRARADHDGRVRGDDLFGEERRAAIGRAPLDDLADTALGDPVGRPERRYPVAPRSQQDIPLEGRRVVLDLAIRRVADDRRPPRRTERIGIAPHGDGPAARLGGRHEEGGGRHRDAAVADRLAGRIRRDRNRTAPSPAPIRAHLDVERARAGVGTRSLVQDRGAVSVHGDR